MDRMGLPGESTVNVTVDGPPIELPHQTHFVTPGTAAQLTDLRLLSPDVVAVG
jgi:hypothetical protein